MPSLFRADPTFISMAENVGWVEGGAVCDVRAGRSIWDWKSIVPMESGWEVLRGLRPLRTCGCRPPGSGLPHGVRSAPL